MNKIDLKNIWNSLFDIPNEPSDKMFSLIERYYSHNYRAYHNLSHLIHLFGLLEEAEIKDKAVLFAAFYHDFIYDPYSSDNEIKSAEMAESHLKELKINQIIINRVKTLILATKTHDISPEDVLGNQFLDADMAIIGSESAAYNEYVKNIRIEFKCIPKESFNKGRKAFLQSCLNKKKIFNSDFFNKLEEQARINISKEIESL